MTTKPDLSVEFLGVACENPFFLSSSPVSNTASQCARAFEAGWGGAVFKTLNLEEKFRVVMPSPRLAAYHCGARRFVGLQNAEQISDRPVKDNLKEIAELKKLFPKKALCASILGYEEEDWRLLARMAEDAGCDFLELNFSCPQMAREDAGHRVGQQFDAVRRFTAAAKGACRLPVVAKMTPNITDMLPVALAAKEGGADAIAAINTIRAITDVDLETLTPQPDIHGRSAITGYSGEAVKPIAMRFVAEMARARELCLPVSAIGGVTTWRDAVKFILLGAATVQATTAVMRHGVRIIEDMIEGATDWMKEKGYSRVEEFRGISAAKLCDPAELDHRFQVVSLIDEEKCIGCGQCYISCRDGANSAIEFDRERRKASVDEEKCVGCLLCRHICPVWDCVGSKVVDTASARHAAVIAPVGS